MNQSKVEALEVYRDIMEDNGMNEWRHPKWCREAAEIITGETYDDPQGERISTEYGEKTCTGVADIIYQKYIIAKQRNEHDEHGTENTN